MLQDVEAAVSQAVGYFWSGTKYVKARPLLNEVVAQRPDHLAAQWFLFQCELIDGEVAAAKARSEVLMRLSFGSPIMLLSQVRALVAGGEVEAARAAVLRHPGLQLSALDRLNLGNNELAMLVALELVSEKNKSLALSREMCREDDVALVDWSQVQDAEGVKATLAHMRERVKGRDICIYGRGPSLNELGPASDAVRSRNFVPFVINEFQEVAGNILGRMGKRPGLVCLTNFDVLRSCANDLRPLIQSDDFIGLSVPLHVRQLLNEATSEQDLANAFADNAHRLFAYTCEGELNCPVPRRPFDFPIVNTMLHALGTAVLLQPRRIFLFGFDGGGDAETGEVYYAESYKDTNLEKGWQSRTERWLWWDSFRVSHIAPTFINHLHLLHDVDYPLIYNVCRHSAITCFPRIGLVDYLALTGDDT